MPEPDQLDGRTVVVGLGATGLSVARYLRAEGRSFALVDSRAEPPGIAELRATAPEVPVVLGPLSKSALLTAAGVVLSPGVSREEPAVAAALEAGLEVIGDVELFARAALAPVVAITGSNGKSTVTSMLRDMARASGWRVSAGGNLGPPALDLLEAQEPDLYVLELSSFQLESTYSLKPAAAAVLNLSEDHFDRYPGMREYVEAKSRIFRGATAVAVPLDLADLARAHGVTDPVTFDATCQGARYRVREHASARWICCADDPVMRVDELPVSGSHNLVNALAALALGDLVALPRAGMVEGLRGFRGLPHRCEQVAEHAGVRWVNDSKGTNVGATVAAVEGLGSQRPLVLIAGGIGKGADFAPLREAVAGRVRLLIVFGRDARVIADAIGDACETLAVAHMHGAIKAASEVAEAGWTVLLSPACASFDMYPNYGARGDDFRTRVQALCA